MRKMNASINASKSNKRISVFGMFGLEEEKKQIKKARGSLCLSDEDLKKRIKEEIKDISDLFEILTEDLMAMSLRLKETEKKDFTLKKATEIDNLNQNFTNVKKIFESA
jgi:inorganic pyrophosphatase